MFCHCNFYQFRLEVDSMQNASNWYNLEMQNAKTFYDLINGLHLFIVTRTSTKQTSPSNVRALSVFSHFTEARACTTATSSSCSSVTCWSSSGWWISSLRWVSAPSLELLLLITGPRRSLQTSLPAQCSPPSPGPYGTASMCPIQINALLKMCLVTHSPVLCRYHTGSLAFGSLILAVVHLTRVILEYLDHRLKGGWCPRRFVVDEEWFIWDEFRTRLFVDSVLFVCV